MVAVFERIDLSSLREILALALEDPEIDLMTFRLQPGASSGTVPDGEIASNFRYLLEVKTEFGTLNEIQLRGHLAQLSGTATDERLLAVTPDAAEPPLVTTIKAADPRLTWFSFASLNRSISDVLEGEWIRDDERLLLRELQHLFVEEGLLGRQDTVLVAAGLAHGFYLKHAAYVCQQGRSFRSDVTHLGFYRKLKIECEIPRVVCVTDDVLFTPDEAVRRRAIGNEVEVKLAELIEATLAEGSRIEGDIHKVFLLSAVGDPETVTLRSPIAHKAGGAFVQYQRYVFLEDLSKAETTADLR